MKWTTDLDDLIWAIKKALATRAHLGVIEFLIEVEKNFFEKSMHQWSEFVIF